MDILLTNDDSHESPLFHFAIQKSKTLGNVTIVVPKEEQSWTGKSMSRFRPLYLDEIILHDDRAYCLDGTPADCTNVGIYHACERKPDMVISGINIGINAGVGFFFASGTIGACLEANIAGIPAVALSQSLAPNVFQEWMQQRRINDAEVERLRAQTYHLLDRVFATLFARDDFLHHPVTWNVNLPYEAEPDCDIVPTFLGHTLYGSCFEKVGDRFHHALGHAETDAREHADGMVVRQGQVSLTCINIRDIGQQRIQL